MQFLDRFSLQGLAGWQLDDQVVLGPYPEEVLERICPGPRAGLPSPSWPKLACGDGPTVQIPRVSVFTVDLPKMIIYFGVA